MIYCSNTHCKRSSICLRHKLGLPLRERPRPWAGYWYHYKTQAETERCAYFIHIHDVRGYPKGTCRSRTTRSKWYD